jgi:hypothetical protein
MMLKTDKAPGLPWIAGTTTDHRSHGGAYLHDRTTAMEPPNIALWGQRNKGLPHTKDPNGASNGSSIMMLKTDKAPGLPWIAGTTTDHRSHGGAYLEMIILIIDTVVS